VFAWARRQGHIDSDPIKDLERPTPRRREAVLTEAQADTVLAAVPDPEFRDLLVALRETGARPGEVAGLTAAGVDLQAAHWRVTNKSRNKTHEATRRVHLTQAALVVSRRLVAEHPEGPIFRNRRGNPWTRHAMACRFAELRAKLGMGPELSAYSFRHLYITTALERGVPIATLAALVGHSDVGMISRVYSKLDRATGHLKQAAEAARRVAGE
jgi:integrase